LCSTQRKGNIHFISFRYTVK